MVYAVLNGLFWEATTDDGGMTLIHGAARGADALADEWAVQDGDSEGLTVEAYPAAWDKYGKRAGYIRNQQMLDEGDPDIVVAFRSAGESRGTDIMIDLAREAGVPTYVVTGP